mmetsp:Transcript_12480/g.39048  ORF Transcript_12480/g.39048 Transcript_12480/m.39048 type:complete len:244 (-) Transcript_12480:3249-3980(-)
MVLPLLISNSSVRAMDLTTTKYCCSSERNRRLPMPPTSMCRHRSLACSSLKEMPSRVSRCLQRVASGMRSSPAGRSSAKSSSGLAPLLWASSRSAAEASAYLASTRDWQLLSTASMMVLLFFSAAAALPSIFISSRFASSMGPLTAALPSLACCSLMLALASVTLVASEACSFSPASSTETGVAKASSSSPCSEVMGCVVSSSSFRQASMASTLTLASPMMASAAFFSLASMCALRSASSRFA